MIERLKKEATWLKKSAWAGSPEARGRVRAVWKKADVDDDIFWKTWFSHMKALHVVAKENGFNSWSEVLKCMTDAS